MIQTPLFKLLILSGFMAVLSSGCGSKKQETKTAPVKMSNPVKEKELNILTLTPEAEKRIGIQLYKVAEENTSNSGLYSGEIMAIPGQLITISAPLAGSLIAPSNGIGLQAGQKVVKGQPLYRLLILPSEKDLISAKEDVAQKQVQYDVAVKKVQRNKQLLEDKAGSLRAVQEAEAELAGISAALNVASARLELLKGNTSSSVADRLSTLDIESPVTGTIQRVFSAPSQIVATAAPIVEIAATGQLWVRVPIYAGDIDKISKQEGATVQLLSDFSGSAKTIQAKRIQGPQTADAFNTTVDLFYEINNSSFEYRPGEKVSVRLAYQGNQKGLTIPYSAVVYDIHGGTWIYQKTEETNYSRIRIEVERVENKKAIVKRGLKGGENIVITGAAELFGTEFGGGK
jgi:cobalt-zinc-cadmium efflux system membrane fusion protein